MPKIESCIMVKGSCGLYEIHPNAEPEPWDEVQAIAERVERLEALTGWPPWTAAYLVHFERYTLTYFVEEQAERQYSKLTALCNLVRPWLENDDELLRAFRETLESWEAERKGGGNAIDREGGNLRVTVDGEGKQRLEQRWPFVDQNGNYANPDWRWPSD